MRSSGYRKHEEAGKRYFRDLLSTAAYRLYLAVGAVFVVFSTVLSAYALIADDLGGLPLGFSASSLAFALLSLCLFACYLILEVIYKGRQGLSLALAFKAILLSSEILASLSAFLLFGTYAEGGEVDFFLFPANLIVGVFMFVYFLASLFYVLWRKENGERYLKKIPPEDEEGKEIVKRG